MGLPSPRHGAARVLRDSRSAGDREARHRRNGKRLLADIWSGGKVLAAPGGIDLLSDFRALVEAFEEEGLDYAVVGALALAIHGFPRATTDLDFLVRAEDLDRALEVARTVGYRFPAEPMTFVPSGLKVQRVTRVEGEDHSILDFLLVNDRIRHLWDTRRRVASRQGTARVISREALVEMKALAGRPQDLVDIERLRSENGA